MKHFLTAFLAVFSLVLSGFEVPGKWIVEKHHGGEGSGEITSAMSRSGKHSFKLKKDNAVGWVSIRSAEPVKVKAGVKYAFGG
jgi:hypothetical protein